MAVDYPTYPVTTLAQAEDMIIFTGNQIHDIMNADATSVIEAEDGAIPSIRKALVDNMYFKTPQIWVASTQITDPLQLKQFTDGGWYFAPTATVSAPVNLGVTPIGDTNWKPWNKDQAAVYQPAKRLAAEAGLNMVSGSFYFGGTLNSTDDVLLFEGDGKYYSWSSALPKVVFAGSSPTTSGGIGAGAWVDRTQETFRSELLSNGGIKNIGGVGYLCAESYSGASDNEILQNAINDAITKKITFITFNRDYYVTSEILNRQEVIFVGKHEITGAGSYRMRIVRGDEKSIPVLNGITAEQLPAFSRKKSPIIVMVGDSISTSEPNTIDGINSQYSYIKEKIVSDNPTKAPVFYNRGVGGQTFYQLNTVASSNFPDWYTNHATPWLDYVSALNPDLVIVSMGMNDGGDNFVAAALTDVITKIKAFSSKPDVVLVTCPVPSTHPGGSWDAIYGTKAAQEGRDYAAAAVRSAGAFYGVPVIDANRVFNVVRDGFDVVDSHSVAVNSPASVNGGYLSPVECRNWSATVVMANRAQYGLANPLAVQVGPKLTELVFIKLDGDNQILLDCYNTSGSYKQYGMAGQIVPDSPHSIRIEVFNQQIRVFVVGSSIDSEPKFVPMYVGGGLYTPGIGRYDDNYGSGTLSSITSFAYGEHTKYLPSITNNEMWGIGDGGVGTKTPYGGNGINHPTSTGASAVYKTAIDACDFSAIGDGVGNWSIPAESSVGGYERIGGKLVKVWGRRLAQTTGATVTERQLWPSDLASEIAGYSSLQLVVSGGVNDTGTTYATAQTIINTSTPDGSGFYVTWHCPVQDTLGRYADWVLSVAY